MEIAILTLPLHTNYGQILQCYALQTYLQRQGHSVVVLDDPLYSLDYYLKIPFIYLKRAYKKYFLKKQLEVFTLPYQREREYTQKFIDKHINRIGIHYWDSPSILKYDAYIVGSDQVWRPKYFESDKRPSIELAFLSFVNSKDALKLSYAASFGVDHNEFTSTQQSACSKLLQSFDAVSVREASAVELCRKMFGVSAAHVVDPTMLIEKQDFLALFQGTIAISSERKMFVYLMDKNDAALNYINILASSIGLEPNMCYNDAFQDFSEDTFIPIPKRSVEQWLSDIYNSDIVVTDSFHGCVFSILFNKPFITLVNEERGLSRIKSLLDMFNLQDRMVSRYDNFDSDKLYNIDWNEVNRVLREKRKEAYQFLEILN